MTMAKTLSIMPTQNLEPFKGVKKIALEEYFTSGHRTCQGCESALVMKLITLGRFGRSYRADRTSLYRTAP